MLNDRPRLLQQDHYQPPFVLSVSKHERGSSFDKPRASATFQIQIF